MTPVLVDTSVWIEFLRSPQWNERAAVIALLEGDAARMIDPTAAELLYGVRGDRKRQGILRLVYSVTRLGTPLDAWIAAGDLGRRWRERGRTLSVIDCLQAVTCATHKLPLWTLDKDFAPLAESREIELYRPLA